MEPDNIGLNGMIVSPRRQSLSLTIIKFRPPRRSSPRGVKAGNVAAHNTILKDTFHYFVFMLDNEVHVEHPQFTSWRRYKWHTLHMHMDGVYNIQHIRSKLIGIYSFAVTLDFKHWRNNCL